MKIPEGVQNDQNSNKVLNYATHYGLKQAGRVWNNRIDSKLISLGYQPTKSDHCIYFLQNKSGIHFIALYVDDLLFASSDPLKILASNRIFTLCSLRYKNRPLLCCKLFGKIFKSANWNPLVSAIQNVLRYIKGTLDVGIYYSNNNKELSGFSGYSDSDWGADVDTSRSTMGFIFLLIGGPISWSSKVQPRVAESSTEAE